MALIGLEWYYCLPYRRVRQTLSIVTQACASKESVSVTLSTVCPMQSNARVAQSTVFVYQLQGKCMHTSIS